MGAGSKPVRIGLVGCCGDHMWRGHLKHLIGMEGIEIVGACDKNAAELAALVAKHREAFAHARVFADAFSLITSPLVDVVIDCTPDRFHLEHLRLAVQHWKHVFMEKPLAVQVSDLSRLREALLLARARKLVVSTCHPRRFDPPYVETKKRLPQLAERFGALLAVELDFSYPEPDPEKAGLHKSLLIDHAPHEIDYAHFLLGHAPTEFWKLEDGQRFYRVAGKREDGVSLAFTGTRRLPEKTYPERIRLRFERGGYDLACKTGLAQIEDHVSSSVDLVAVGATDYDRRFGDMMRHFVAAVRGDEAHYLEARDLFANTEGAVRLTHGARWIYAPADL